MLALCVLGLFAAPVRAEDCLVCDREIVITSAFANCFLAKVSGLIDDMKRQQLPFQLVNLGTCEGVIGSTRGSDEVADSARQVLAWENIRNATPDTRTEPTTNFILDEAGLRCLEKAIRADLASFDPAAAFRPGQMCPQ